MGQLCSKKDTVHRSKTAKSSCLTEEIDRSRAHKIQFETGVLNYQGYQPLCDAAVAEDWATANKYLEIHQNAIKNIFKSRDSAQEIVSLLALAVAAKQWMFVEKIVNMAPPEALEAINPESGFTILHMATVSERIKLVQALVKKNAGLTQIFSQCENAALPLQFAIRKKYTDRQREVMEYLASVTKDEWAD